MSADASSSRGSAPIAPESGPATTRSGAIWSTLNGGATVLIPLGVFVLFARMMKPSEIAPIMIAVATLEIVKALGPQGVYDVVIRHPESDRGHYESASALFALSGIALTLVFAIVVVLSPMMMQVVLPLQAILLGLKILLDYLVMQPQAVLARRMAFKRLGSRSLAAGLISGAGGIAIAFVVSPVLGLISYYVLQSLVIYLMTSIGTAAAVFPRWHPAAMREMASEGARATGVRLTAVGFNYVDQLMLGTMIPAAQLGLYNLGKRIEVVAISLSSSFSQMMFQPIFATAEPEHRAPHMGRGIAAISLVCGVPLVVLALHARLAVPFIFGPQWSAAAPVVAVLGIGGLARALGGVAGSLLTVTHRNALMLRIGFWAAGVSVIVIFGLARYGVEIVAMGTLARNVVFTWVQFRVAGDARGRLLALFVRSCFVPLLAVAAVSLAASMAATALLGTATPLGTFIVLATAGLAGAGAGAALLYPRM